MMNDTVCTIDKYCNCKTVSAVARDMKSTCMQCGGIDAYKKSTLRLCKCGHDIKRHDDHDMNPHECRDCNCVQFCDNDIES